VRRGAQFIPGDLGDADLARRLCQGVDAVVHCAGAVGNWGRYQDFYQGNVVVTENVVEACLKEHVRRLVHLSSPSIYFNGRSQQNINEQQVPRRLHDHYGATKYLAEQKVFGAQEFGLEVLALRPRFVTGAGDVSIFPRLLQMQGKRRLAIIGNGLNKVDFTSVQNLNEALLSALFADEQALGQAYNISNGHPLPLWDVVNYVMRQMQLPQVTRYRSFGLAYSLAALNEGACMLWPGRPQPTLSRLGMQVMSKDFTLDISRARQLLDYRPTVSLWTALDEFCGWWKAQASNQ
jgi:nucleoside-diphosphate-sugar epimerase